MRYAKKTDANHASIRDALKRYPGLDVWDTSGIGHGVPDLCVKKSSWKQGIWLEIKDPEKVPSKRRLTDAEQKWVGFNGAVTAKVETFEDVLVLLGKA